MPFGQTGGPKLSSATLSVCHGRVQDKTSWAFIESYLNSPIPHANRDGGRLSRSSEGCGLGHTERIFKGSCKEINR